MFAFLIDLQHSGGYLRGMDLLQFQPDQFFHSVHAGSENQRQA
ncbi:hypothetical protein BSU04_18160 [Caballeronia sordidicola]|uniref:Uncharacterized protein n=1 Tax=Caballeronia sordidicola TaxID=196367 RepID=A0A226X0H2_CABSO|nr:hypothetical protein BSU04_18160 [Caballeronia sordidicola]